MKKVGGKSGNKPRVNPRRGPEAKSEDNLAPFREGILGRSVKDRADKAGSAIDQARAARK